MELIQLIARDTCDLDNDFNGQLMGARISSVFAVLVASGFGSFFPILSSRYSFIRLPPLCFFIAKFFGSGVIIATAFIHLLQPANENLTNECLGGTFAEYPWAFAICLMTLFSLFFMELMAYKFIELRTGEEGHVHSHFGDEEMYLKTDELKEDDDVSDALEVDHHHHHLHNDHEVVASEMPLHFAHAKSHQNPEVIGTPAEDFDKEAYYGQLLNIFVLEFGIIFHSVFVGLSLAVSGDEFKTLYIVIVFHQCFEGLGLGTRIATTNWGTKRLTPWVLALGYTISTPIAIAIGLGVRNSYPPGSRTALITNGVFDSVSSGVLIYTGLIELMAHEFLYSDEFKGRESLPKMLLAYFIMCWGTGLMALLGRWA